MIIGNPFILSSLVAVEGLILSIIHIITKKFNFVNTAC